MKFIIILFLLILSNYLSAQNLNTESATKFWKIIDVVKKDIPISNELWSEFRNAKADSLWFGMARQLDKNYELYYRNAIEIVFRPSNKSKLDSIINLPKDNSRNLQNIFVIGMYQNYFLNEQGIREFYKRVSETAYLDTIYNIAITMLPKKFKKPTERLNALNIYIHGIESGANATRHGIMFSMAGLYNFEKEHFGILGAHELHHLLRVSKLKGSIQSNHKFAVDIMESCLNEGSADILNNLPVFEKPEFTDLKTMTLINSEEKLRTIDKWFSERFADTSKTRSEEEIATLFNYLGGHNPGYFMARTIVVNGFKNELRETIDNPFHFFLLYQKAAKKDKSKPPTFSIKTINFIKQLEKLYYNK
ncbi:hypothetical protein AD998_20645 [bacterium 336/3]|nr:hypothetical protein AD998_20645 [bacterium 336/3]